MSSKSNLFKTGLILASLPLTVLAVKTVLDIRRGAAGVPANIIVDTASPQGNIPSSLWQNLSQGGEEPKDMIGPVAPLLARLQPEVIRIDHLFDFYNVDHGGGVYDFSGLDIAIASILKTGAVPMLSLSYTTNSQSVTGQNAGQPKDWNQWYALVKATAHRYSVEKNIKGIYYEVWNEPDLFGSWKYNRDPNYSTLYIKSAQAVADGAGNSVYKIGGPAITAYYSNWIKSLFRTASSNRIRLDFISWHKYSKKPQDYLNDFENLNSILADYPQYFDIERIITEIGPNSDPDPWYDSSDSGVHLISLATQLSGKIHRLFSFEPVDGPTSRSSNSSGWGMITHGGTPKPRYNAMLFLNLLTGLRLASTGDGSWVTSLSSVKGSKIQSLIVNYDLNRSHTESVPLTFQNLIPGNYTLKFSYYPARSVSSKTVNVANTSLILQNDPNLLLSPNMAVLVELTKI